MQNSEAIWTIVDEKRDGYIALSDRTRATPYICPLPSDVEPPIKAMSMGT